MTRAVLYIGFKVNFEVATCLVSNVGTVEATHTNHKSLENPWVM